MRKLPIILTIFATLTFSSQALAVSPTEGSSLSSVKHIVKAKETLSQIASTHKVTISDIVKLNNLSDPNKLHIGQTLIISQKETTVPAKSVVTPAPETVTKNYVVKPRDTFSSIAKSHDISLEAIIAANNSVNPNNLQIGQVLNLPGAGQNVTLASRSDEERPRDTDRNLADQIIDYAKDLLGRPYSYGADGPKSFDCSGFTTYVFDHFDIDLPRTSASQADKGSKVSRSDLIPGDLVFFKTSSRGISHVGIYIGSDDFIHASTGGGKVEISSLSEAYYNKRYVTARRILD